MSKATNCIKLHRMFLSNDKLTREQIEKEFSDIDSRSVTRLISFLKREFNAPVKYNKKECFYYYENAFSIERDNPIFSDFSDFSFLKEIVKSNLYFPAKKDNYQKTIDEINTCTPIDNFSDRILYFSSEYDKADKKTAELFDILNRFWFSVESSL